MKKCPYCAEKIQDDAIVCRFCGRDIDNASITKRHIIERTDKKFKKQTMVAFIILVIGAIFILTSIPSLAESGMKDDSAQQQLTFGILVLLLGIIWETINKIRKWWDRG